MGTFAVLEGCAIVFAVELNGLNLGSGYFRKNLNIIYSRDYILAE